jgi:hypothetical protein
VDGQREPGKHHSDVYCGGFIQMCVEYKRNLVVEQTRGERLPVVACWVPKVREAEGNQQTWSSPAANSGFEDDGSQARRCTTAPCTVVHPSYSSRCGRSVNVQAYKAVFSRSRWILRRSRADCGGWTGVQQLTRVQMSTWMYVLVKV